MGVSRSEPEREREKERERERERDYVNRVTLVESLFPTHAHTYPHTPSYPNRISLLSFSYSSPIPLLSLAYPCAAGRVSRRRSLYGVGRRHSRRWHSLQRDGGGGRQGDDGAQPSWGVPTSGHQEHPLEAAPSAGGPGGAELQVRRETREDRRLKRDVRRETTILVNSSRTTKPYFPPLSSSPPHLLFYLQFRSEAAQGGEAEARGGS